ncbi:hypothetical protein EJ110_NYTH57574 [Nymphaea thermarum]|nr:hypothetical protein EJ110_NYTH57574 [Nymphaea thermarum]
MATNTSGNANTNQMRPPSAAGSLGNSAMPPPQSMIPTPSTVVNPPTILNSQPAVAPPPHFQSPFQTQAFVQAFRFWKADEPMLTCPDIDAAARHRFPAHARRAPSPVQPSSAFSAVALSPRRSAFVSTLGRRALSVAWSRLLVSGVARVLVPSLAPPSCYTLSPLALPLLVSWLTPLVVVSSSRVAVVNTDHTDVGISRTKNFPVQVTTIRLTKENYLQWSAAITMGIAGRGRIAYVNGRKVEPVATSAAWDTWFLEDNQVKSWIVNSISSDIQPLILPRDLSVADFYAALKSKWEDLDYCSDDTWNCPQDQMHDVAKEWENRIFLFLVGLNDEFKNVRSQILNSEEAFSIEDVYSCVEAEEQMRLVISGRKGDHMSHNERSALVSRAPMGIARPPRKCTHCKKLGHTMELCWNLHPEKKNSKGRFSGGKKPISDASNPSGGKTSISAEQIRELRAI